MSGDSLRSLIDRQASERPDAVFLVDPLSHTELTYADLWDRTSGIASALASHGLMPGQSVAYALGNGIDTTVTILGIMYGGYLATAINLVAGNDTIAYVIEHSDAQLVIADATGLPSITAALASSDVQAPITSLRTLISETPDDPVDICGAVDDEADGLLMYTSGTTGKPKGVVLTHRNLLAGGANTAQGHELGDADRALCVLPLYHINGLCVTIMGPLVSGGSAVMPDRFSVSTFWDMLRNHACTWFSVVPTQISYLLHAAEAEGHDNTGLETLRFGRSASAPLAPEVQSAFEKKFAIPVIETMGLTETAAQILSNPMPPGTRKIGSPGIAVGNEIMIAGDDLKEVARGEEGEVLVRGDNVMRCYRNNEDATRASLTDERWLRTGDLGRMDDDGYVFITGRLKELIIKGGENIAPREIDDALYSHPAVIEAAAFACACARYGQTVEACVKVEDGCGLTEADLIEICRQRVGAFKAPERVYFLDDLPKGPSGKIQRMKLGEIVARAGPAL